MDTVRIMFASAVVMNNNNNRVMSKAALFRNRYYMHYQEGFLGRGACCNIGQEDGCQVENGIFPNF